MARRIEQALFSAAGDAVALFSLFVAVLAGMIAVDAPSSDSTERANSSPAPSPCS